MVPAKINWLLFLSPHFIQGLGILFWRDFISDSFPCQKPFWQNVHVGMKWNEPWQNWKEIIKPTRSRFCPEPSFSEGVYNVNYRSGIIGQTNVGTFHHDQWVPNPGYR